MTLQTVYLKDYKKPNFQMERVHLEIDIFDAYVQVSSEMSLKRETSGALLLHGEGLQLLSIHVNGSQLQPCDYEFDNEDLLLHACPDVCQIKIVNRINPYQNTRLSGLFRSGNLLCTQCEAEGFRKITYFPDRPDVLSVYTVKISADRQTYPQLLSNGNLIEQGESGSGRHWVIWHDPFKKPCYLFALVAGDLAYISEPFKTKSGKLVDLQIYVEPGEEAHCGFAMKALKKAMRWDEKQYGREYDLDRFMIVAVKHFNGGAMENKGLNIFNAKYIYQDPRLSTDEEFMQAETMIAHEYFHNWTGNRVTCRDWFQLSLKEGLTVFRDQEYSRAVQSRDAKRIYDVKIIFAGQFPEDAGTMAHSVRPESYQEISNFYTSTVYHKGAEVIRMLHSLLGAQGFHRGMDYYFESFDGKAVTIDDFLSAMEKANQRDLSQFKRWYHQAGTPQVAVSTHFEAGSLSIHLKQSCPPNQNEAQYQPLEIPVKIALFQENGKAIALDNDILELKEMAESFVFKNLKSKPVVSVLRDFSAPVYLHYPTSLDEKITLLRFETSGFSQWQAAQSLMIDCIHEWLKSDASLWQIPKPLASAFKELLIRKYDDLSCQADILTPPWHLEVINGLYDLDICRVEQVRDAFRKSLSTLLYADAKSVYDKLWLQEDHKIDAKAMGRRKLRNLCLMFLMKANEPEALDRCQTQFYQAETMSDQLAALTLLANAASDLSQKALDTFYAQWKAYPLVIEKWFAVQACMESAGTLERVKRLLMHSDFNLAHPNQVMALIGSFVMRNPRHFHAEDGSGYEFLKTMILKVDALNPQIATILLDPLTRSLQLNQPRQAKIQAVLNDLASHPLSKNIREKVEKSIVGY